MTITQYIEKVISQLEHIILSSINIEDVRWAKNELHGYNCPVPSYRTIKQTISATYSFKSINVEFKHTPLPIPVYDPEQLIFDQFTNNVFYIGLNTLLTDLNDQNYSRYKLSEQEINVLNFIFANLVYITEATSYITTQEFFFMIARIEQECYIRANRS